MQRLITLTANLFLLLFFSVLLSAAGTSMASIDESFEVSAGGSFILTAQSARVDVRGSSDDQVRIHISRNDDDDEAIHDDFLIEFSQTGDDVTLEVKRRQNFAWFNNTRSIRIDVELPGRFDVDLTTSGGSIELRDLIGEIEARTSGGRLLFQNVDGPIQARTSGGSIHLDGTSADADLKTSGGSIRVGVVGGTLSARTSGGSIVVEQTGGPVVAKTSGGRIEIGTAHGSVEAKTSGGGIEVGIASQPEADSSLSTSGGSVTVRLDPTLALALDARSSGGKVFSELSIAVSGEVSKRRLTGAINGGGPLLRLRTSGGSVHLVTL